jgi:hypothetical protein
MNRGFGIYCFLLNVVTFAIPYGLGWHLSTLQTGWLSARKWTCCAWVRWYDAYLTMLVSRGYVRIDLLSFCLILSLTIVHMLLAFCNLRTSIIFWLVVSAFFRQILHFNPSYNCLMFGSQLTSISFGYLWMVWNHKTIYVYIYILWIHLFIIIVLVEIAMLDMFGVYPIFRHIQIILSILSRPSSSQTNFLSLRHLSFQESDHARARGLGRGSIHTDFLSPFPAVRCNLSHSADAAVFYSMCWEWSCSMNIGKKQLHFTDIVIIYIYIYIILYFIYIII